MRWPSEGRCCMKGELGGDAPGSKAVACSGMTLPCPVREVLHAQYLLLAEQYTVLTAGNSPDCLTDCHHG